MYLHAITGVFAAKRRDAIRREHTEHATAQVAASVDEAWVVPSSAGHRAALGQRA